MKTLILYKADDVASFCDAFFAYLMNEEVELFPCHEGAELPDTSGWTVVDVRDMNTWHDLDMASEPAWLKYEWLNSYAHDKKLALPSSREVQAGIRSWPLDLQFWFMHAGQGPQDVHSQGTALLRAASRHISFEDLL